MKKLDIKGIYNKTAREYEEFVIPCKICQYMVLIHGLNINGDERILELGSGPGYLAIEISKLLKNGEVVGMDISEKMVEIASQRVKEKNLKNVRFIVGDVTNLSFEDKSFDICVNSYLIHWLNDVERFLYEIYRVLKDDGKLGIISPSQEWYDEIRRTYQKIMEKYKKYLENGTPSELVGLKIYSEEELKKLLTRFGFKICTLISFKFKEAIPISLCLKRIHAKSAEAYLSLLPTSIRENARRDFFEELMKISSELATTESGYIIIAIKE